MNDTYIPRPLDTTHITLPAELMALVELLAENTHENWAKGRMTDGWTYGPERNDTLRTHPGLVPYHKLSESEKEYDRVTSMETLKAIVALGWRVGT